MGRRYAAFLLAAVGAGAEFFGAMVGQGLLGQGLVFGLAGPGTVHVAVLLGVLAATVSLVAAVMIMFVADARTLGRVLIAAGILGSIAAGPIFALTALAAVGGGLIALRIDASIPII
jgi:hypothetical protein